MFLRRPAFSHPFEVVYEPTRNMGGQSALRATMNEPRALVVDLTREAIRLGFSRVGIAPAVPTPRHESFRSWLADGLAGPMAGWLHRHASVREHPNNLLDGVRSVVMLATDYLTDDEDDSLLDQSMERTEACHAADRRQPGLGKVSRYALGDDYHDLLRERVNRLSAWLTTRVPGSSACGVVDSAPLAEREFAWLAGLGWFGKNTMLISPVAGSWFFLSAVLTDVPLPIDSPIEVDHCGTCTACLDACPTGALVAPRVLDARRCISTLTIEDHGTLTAERREELDGWLFGCDVCQQVCPWNRHAPIVREEAFLPGPADRSLPLAELLMLDESAFRKRFTHSPLKRAKRRGILRTAALLLGNDPEPGAAAALSRAVNDDDAVVRLAAAWAIGRWLVAGVEATWADDVLRRRLVVEVDPDVRPEIVAALAEGSVER